MNVAGYASKIVKLKKLKNIVLYFIAAFFLLITLFFFKKAYQELIQYTELTSRNATVYNYFLNLSGQVNKAAVLNQRLINASKQAGVENIFYTDSLAIIKQINVLNATVVDSVNIQIAGRLDKKIRPELSWLLNSNVPDSIINHHSLAHLRAIQNITTLINQGISRTAFLIKYHKQQTNDAIKNVETCIILFIAITAISLFYITYNFFRQKSKSNFRFQRLLENITDGFISLDENMCYTYVNGRIEEMVGMKAEALIGKNIWEVFPDAVGSAPYHAVQTAFTEKRYVCNEDYYEPLNLWLENRAYPSEKGVSLFVRDITKQKNEEQHLKLLESVITNTPDAILITEAQQLDEPGPRIIYANEAFTTLTGYTPEELVGKTPRIFQGPKTDRAELDKLKAALKKCAHCEITVINYHKSGAEYWINILVSPVFDDKGICTHFIAIERDITDKRKSEQQIEQLNERFTLISKATNDALFEWNFESQEVWWSESYFKLFGFDPKQPHPTREEWILKIQPDSRILIDGIVKSIHENGLNSWQHEIDYYRPDGSKGTLFNRGFVIRDEQQKPIRMLGSYQDITRQKNEELQRALLHQAITDSFKEKNTILESIGDAFFAVDENWVVTYWNNTAEKVLQTPKAAIVNKNLWDVFSTSVDSHSYKKYHEAINTNQSVHFEDHFAPLNKWYEISAYPTGKGLSVYFKDITERKLSEEQLMLLNKNLKKQARQLSISNAELEQFAYVASHDLQEPLRMVTGFLSQLERKYGDTIDDKGKQYIHFAVDGAKRMRQIILDLLEFSRVGRADDDFEEVNLNLLVANILALHRKQIEDKKAVIECDDLPTLNTYAVPMRQVFQNLIENSLKYQTGGNIPFIRIRCTSTEKHYQFSVQDNGIGIDAEYFDKVFIIFQRLHNKDEYSGTGMGLAVTKKIVENLGGKISLESEQGKGSTFYFTILKNKV